MAYLLAMNASWSLLLVLAILGVHHTAVRASLRRPWFRPPLWGFSGGSPAGGARLRIESGARLLKHLFQQFGLDSCTLRVLGRKRGLDVPDVGLDARPLIRRHFVAEIREKAFSLIANRIGVVELLRLFAATFVILGEALGVLDHSRLVRLGAAGRAADANRLFPASGRVLRDHTEDAAGIDVERHFDLGNAP